MNLEYAKNQMDSIIEQYKNNKVELTKEQLQQMIDEFIEMFDSENLISDEDKEFYLSIKEDL